MTDNVILIDQKEKTEQTEFEKNIKENKKREEKLAEERKKHNEKVKKQYGLKVRPKGGKK